MRHYSRGFTLIELAIVLVIVGLLTGGVVVGRSMIRTSQIQSVIGDITRFKEAIESFKQKYNGLPGDIANAESFWGSDTSCPDTPYTATPHKTTCNGNGDGHVGYTDTSGVYYPTEAYRFWQQLADAGMIEGTYTGISGPASTYNSILGVNVPSARVPGTGYYFNFQYLRCGSTQTWPMVSHDMLFGALLHNYHTSGSALTPAEALSLDQKIDDGLPGSGTVISYKPAFNNCSTNSDATISTYNVAYKNVACSLQFLMNF